MMKFLAVAVLVLAVGAMAYEVSLPEEDLQSVFTGYMTKFNKMYARDEFFNRYRIWKENYAFILNHNSLPEGENKGVKLAANHLSDLTRAEYKAMLGFRLASQKAGVQLTPMDEGSDDDTSSIDWRTLGAVNAVKDQGQCGSCWAFSAVAGAEAAVFNAKKVLPSLSEQELVDCTTNAPYNCAGCSGCLMHSAFQYMIDKKGSCTEAEYPYTAMDGTCAASSCKAKKTPIKSYTNVTCSDSNFCSAPLLKTNETDMVTYVLKAVLSVAIEADSMVFQNYKSGILDDVDCGTQLDHGVAIVGFGTDAGKAYWIVRNSWADTWGDKGYIKIARGKNTCGIALYSNQPYA